MTKATNVISVNKATNLTNVTNVTNVTKVTKVTNLRAVTKVAPPADPRRDRMSKESRSLGVHVNLVSHLTYIPSHMRVGMELRCNRSKSTPEEKKRLKVIWAPLIHMEFVICYKITRTHKSNSKFQIKKHFFLHNTSPMLYILL